MNRDRRLRALLGALVLALAGLAGCARQVPFTPRLRAAIGSDARLRSLQFFMGAECRLERVAQSRAGQVQGGQLVYQRGEAIDVVRIKRGTPGVLVELTPTELVVSFEEGAALAFGAPPSDGPEARYYLLGRWDEQQRFHVLYRGIDYVQTSGEPCVLHVAQSVERSYGYRERTVDGQTVE